MNIIFKMSILIFKNIWQKMKYLYYRNTSLKWFIYLFIRNKNEKVKFNYCNVNVSWDSC